MHYYEDGNVRLTTTKRLTLSISGSTPSANEVLRQIALAEKKYQEELNRGFTLLSEGAFKGLRRQLPVTRQKVEWEKIGGYRVSALLELLPYAPRVVRLTIDELGQDIGGGRSR